MNEWAEQVSTLVVVWDMNETEKKVLQRLLLQKTSSKELSAPLGQSGKSAQNTTSALLSSLLNQHFPFKCFLTTSSTSHKTCVTEFLCVSTLRASENIFITQQLLFGTLLVRNCESQYEVLIFGQRRHHFSRETIIHHSCIIRKSNWLQLQ